MVCPNVDLDGSITCFVSLFRNIYTHTKQIIMMSRSSNLYISQILQILASDSMDHLQTLL